MPTLPTLKNKIEEALGDLNNSDLKPSEVDQKAQFVLNNIINSYDKKQYFISSQFIFSSLAKINDALAKNYKKFGNKRPEQLMEIFKDACVKIFYENRRPNEDKIKASVPVLSMSDSGLLYEKSWSLMSNFLEKYQNEEMKPLKSIDIAIKGLKYSAEGFYASYFEEMFDQAVSTLIETDNAALHRELPSIMIANVAPFEPTHELIKEKLVRAYGRSSHVLIEKHQKNIEDSGSNQKAVKYHENLMVSLIKKINKNYKAAARAKQLPNNLADSYDSYILSIKCVDSGSRAEDELVKGLLQLCDDAVTMCPQPNLSIAKNNKRMRGFCSEVILCLDLISEDELNISEENIEKIIHKRKEYSNLNKTFLSIEKLHSRQSKSSENIVNVIQDLNINIKKYMNQEDLTHGFLNILYDAMNNNVINNKDIIFDDNNRVVLEEFRQMCKTVLNRAYPQDIQVNAEEVMGDKKSDSSKVPKTSGLVKLVQ